MIRTFLFSMILLSAFTAKAQPPLSYGMMNGLQPGLYQFDRKIDTNQLNKKWSITKYAGVSAGFLSFNGGNRNFLSAPLGIQVNRQLSNNVAAFAGVSVAPSWSPFVHPLYQPLTSKYNGFMTPNRFGTYSTAQMGLMYINNERTFSISGSIGVGRSDYFGGTPFFTPAPAPAPGKKFRY